MKTWKKAYTCYVNLQDNIIESIRLFLRKVLLVDKSRPADAEKNEQKLNQLASNKHPPDTVEPDPIEKTDKTKKSDSLTLHEQKKRIKDLKDSIFINNRHND